MKKTTLLLIGALAFVLQSATAQYQLYYNDFSARNAGDNPGDPAAGVGWDYWHGGGAPFTVTVEALQGYVFEENFMVATWAEGAQWWQIGGIASSGGPDIAPLNNALSDLTFSCEAEVFGTSQNWGGNAFKIQVSQDGGWSATYDVSGLVNDGSAQLVTFNLGDLTADGGTYNAADAIHFQIQNSGWSSGGTLDESIAISEMSLTAVNPAPEPGTIALLTLGGLGALVAIRRRRA